MAEIYSDAANVLVWLGEGSSQVESDNIAIAFQCLRQPRHTHFREHLATLSDGKAVSVCLEHAALHASNGVLSITPRHDKEEIQLALINGQTPPEGTFIEHFALPNCLLELFDLAELKFTINRVHKISKAFLYKRYWVRRWGIQELYHASNGVRLLWADHEITLQQLKTKFRNMESIDWINLAKYIDCNIEEEVTAEFSSADDKLRAPSGIPGSNYLIGELAEHGGGSIRLSDESTKSCGAFNCSDPRDYLYALLSFDPETQLRPDYSLTTDQVYIGFFLHVLEKTSCLQSLLESAGLAKMELNSEKFETYLLPKAQDERAASLPSWCFDLRETFVDLHERSILLGPCSVNSQRKTLSCCATVVGTLYNSPHGVVDCSSAGSGLPVTSDLPGIVIEPRMRNFDVVQSESRQIDAEPGSPLPVKWTILDGKRPATPGDLVCFFEELAGRLYEETSQSFRVIAIKQSASGELARVACASDVKPDLQVWNAEKGGFVYCCPLHWARGLEELEGCACYRKTLCIC